MENVKITNGEYDLCNGSACYFQYDPEARRIVVDVKKPEDNKDLNLAHMAYYMEKDVSGPPGRACGWGFRSCPRWACGRGFRRCP